MRQRRFNFVLNLVICTLVVASCNTLREDYSYKVAAAADSTTAAQLEEIERLLDVDRLHYYISKSAQRLASKNPEMAALMNQITPQMILDAKLPSKMMRDPDRFDEAVVKLLRSSQLSPTVKNADIAWGYNFFKRKLAEAFVIRNVPLNTKPIASELSGTITTQEIEAESVRSKTPRRKSLTFDAALYMSDRTTRAPFWDAGSTSGRQIEFHYGSQLNFLETVTARGGEILGEVKAPARNYNKIYVVRYPNEQNLRYAVTEISGTARMDHLIRQISVADDRPMPTAASQKRLGYIYGSSESTHAQVKSQLDAQLGPRGPADVVVIGQKAAFERAIETVSKAAICHRRRADLREHLAQGKGILARIEAAVESGDIISLLSRDSEISQLFDQATIELDKKGRKPLDRYVPPEVWSAENLSHTIADFLMQTKNGEQQVWRLVSNVWGDEIKPIASSLASAGAKRVIYIGTAGAMPQSGIAVGDILVPKAVRSDAGEVIRLKNSKDILQKGWHTGVVQQVSTPYVEDQAWLKANADTAAVELETFSLAKELRAAGIEPEIYLLISDVVGSKETLDSAESSSRARAQDQLIRTVFATANIQGPSKAFVKAIERKVEVGTEQNVLFGYQRISGLRNGASGDEASRFSDEVLVNRLVGAGELLTAALNELNARGVKVNTIHIDDRLARGTYHPFRDQIEVDIVTDGGSKILLDEILPRILASEPKLAQWIRINPATGPPKKGKNALEIESMDRQSLLNHYLQFATTNAGIVTTVGRTGKLKLAIVNTPATSICDGLLLRFQ